MAGGTITYDYALIESCINLMKRETAEIENQTMALAAEVKGLMGTWQGSTAVTYEATSNDLKLELERSNQNLEMTRTALQTGVTGMSETDARGATRIAQ